MIEHLKNRVNDHIRRKNYQIYIAAIKEFELREAQERHLIQWLSSICYPQTIRYETIIKSKNFNRIKRFKFETIKRMVVENVYFQGMF